MGRDTLKYWCFQGQFEGLKPFLFGSVVMSLNASFDDVYKEGEKKWREIMPINIPSKWVPIPGIIFFQDKEV